MNIMLALMPARGEGVSPQSAISMSIAGTRLKPAVVVPMNERWLHEPTMKDRLDRATHWTRNNPAQATSLDELAAKLGVSA